MWTGLNRAELSQDDLAVYMKCCSSCSCGQGCSLGLERLGLEVVSRRFLEPSRLGLEDITSRSRDFSLVNFDAMHQVFGYIRKKIMDLTRKKQVVK